MGHNGATLGKQYAGFALYIIAEAIIFLPLIIFANSFAPDTIPQAGIITAALTAGISAYAFFSKKDFSFMGSFLTIASFVALGIIVCAVLFGIQLGLWFSAAMIVFAGLVILYQTSVMIRRYRNDQYVAARPRAVRRNSPDVLVYPPIPDIFPPLIFHLRAQGNNKRRTFFRKFAFLPKAREMPRIAPAKQREYPPPKSRPIQLPAHSAPALFRKLE